MENALPVVRDHMNRAIALIVCLALFLVACSQPLFAPRIVAGANQPAPTVQETMPAALSPWFASPTGVPTAPPAATTTVTATSLPAAIPAITPTPAVALASTPDPYASLSIEALAAREYGGGELEIVELLEATDHFARYLITYPSGDLTIAGFMNVPHEGGIFPVAIVLHGYIAPSEYETLAYTQRYADALAEAGYFVIHPNLRGYPPSDDGPDPFRTGMAIDVLNLIAIVREQSQDPLGTLRRADANDINLWGHSMGGGIALRVITVNNDAYLKTAVLYGPMSGDEVLNYSRIQQWSDGRRGEFELSVPPEIVNAISPINHLERINAAVSIHHGDADDIVPVEWSTDLCRRLEELGHAPQCHIYSGAPHTFLAAWDEVFMERMIRFFDQN